MLVKLWLWFGRPKLLKCNILGTKILYCLIFFLLNNNESCLIWRDILSILRICALHLTHPKCTHTAVNTHSEQWAAIYAAAPGEQLGVRCLAQSWYWRWRERCTFTSNTYNSCRNLNLQPLDYESDSLTIRPLLPPTLIGFLFTYFIISCIVGFIFMPLKDIQMSFNLDIKNVELCKSCNKLGKVIIYPIK